MVSALFYAYARCRKMSIPVDFPRFLSNYVEKVRTYIRIIYTPEITVNVTQILHSHILSRSACFFPDVDLYYP